MNSKVISGVLSGRQSKRYSMVETREHKALTTGCRVTSGETQSHLDDEGSIWRAEYASPSNFERENALRKQSALLEETKENCSINEIYPGSPSGTKHYLKQGSPTIFDSLERQDICLPKRVQQKRFSKIAIYNDRVIKPPSASKKQSINKGIIYINSNLEAPSRNANC